MLYIVPLGTARCDAMQEEKQAPTAARGVGPSTEWYDFTLAGGLFTTEPSGKPAWCDSRNSTPSSPYYILPLEMNSISKKLLLKMQILLKVSILGLAKKNSIIC